MDDSETCLLVGFIFVALWAWIVWYRPLFSISSLFGNSTVRWSLSSLPIICSALLLIVLATLADPFVRASPMYIFFYLVMGLSWIPIGLWVFKMFGLNATQDVIERRNPAALYA